MTIWGKVDVLAAGEVRLREFRCSGEKRPFVREQARDLAGETRADARDVTIELPRRGAHLRAFGRRTFVVDVTLAAILSTSDEYLRASPSNAPQTSTLITLSGELAERLAHARRSVLPVSRASAIAHEKLLACTTPLELHERAIAVAEALAAGAGEPPTMSARPAAAAWRKLAAEIHYLLATRYAEHLSLDEVARACGVSAFHASRVFRAVTGRSIHQHLVRVRLHHALYELSGGTGGLTGVALRAGFSSHSHFTSAFRRLMGITPSRLTVTRQRMVRRRRPS
jgi:AraC-like DNA-binding protein